MAPFKLKFRMGSSRSTSQEVDSDPQVNQALLGNNNNNNINNNNNNNINIYCNNNLDIGASNSTINSVDCHNLILIENNDKKSLLPNTTIEKLGYTNPIVIPHSNDRTTILSSPVKSYEHPLENNHLDNLDLGSRLTISTENTSSSDIDDINVKLVNLGNQNTNTITNQTKTQSNNGLNELSASTPNIILVNEITSQLSELSNNFNSNFNQIYHNNIQKNGNGINNITITHQLLCNSNNIDGNRKESIDSTEYLISTMTATPPSSQENLLLNSNDDECTGSCEPLFRASVSSSVAAAAAANNKEYQNDDDKNQQYEQHELDDNILVGSSSFHDGILYDDPHSHQYCTGVNDQECPSYIAEMNELENSQRENGNNSCINSGNYVQNNYYGDEDDDVDWDTSQSNNQQLQHEQLQHFISNKSSKKIYKAVAKQWGITCKMSDQCRCMDCQSKYFDCEYDQNEHHKTDGGLGAGTPMFISEVMHGSACSIL